MMPETIILHLPVARGATCYVPTEVSLRLGGGASEGASELVWGLEADGAELADGSPVKGLAGAIQYLLQKIHQATLEQPAADRPTDD